MLAATALLLPASSSAGIGTKYCTATPNSTGSPADISASGSSSSSMADLTLSAMPVPDQFGLFLHGQNPSQIPFGNGYLCAQVQITRSEPFHASGNVATYAYDNSDAKHSLAAFIGTTRHFQCWFRDPMAGGAGFNFSNAIAIPILP